MQAGPAVQVPVVVSHAGPQSASVLHALPSGQTGCFCVVSQRGVGQSEFRVQWLSVVQALPFSSRFTGVCTPPTKSCSGQPGSVSQVVPHRSGSHGLVAGAGDARRQGGDHLRRPRPRGRRRTSSRRRCRGRGRSGAPGTWLPGLMPTARKLAERGSKGATVLHETSAELQESGRRCWRLHPARVEGEMGVRQGASKSATSITASLPFVSAAKANSPRSTIGPAPVV